MSAWYDLGLQEIGKATVGDLTAQTLKVRLLRKTAYTFSQSHQFLSSLPAAIGTDQTLANKTFVTGCLDADDVSFAGISAGAAIDSLAIYKDTGVAGTSPLLVYVDNFSVTPDGTSTLSFQWANSTPFIAKI